MARPEHPVEDRPSGAQHAGSLLSAIPGLLLALPGTLVAGLGLYLLMLATASAVYRRTPGPQEGAPALRLTVLVPAHDEELLVERCVRSLLAQSYPAELMRVVVIADNCTDTTASVASSAGADVMVRTDPAARGKGQALRWAMDRLLAAPRPPDGIVVVDADSVADPGLLAGLGAELAAGHDAVQADYRLLEEPSAGRSQMVEVGFLLFHRVRFLGRARLGMPANLVGNGMLFSSRLLAAHPWIAFTGVEDLEYSMQLRLAGIKPRFAPEARVEGAGPASGGSAVRQRMRWEGGRFHVVRKQLGGLIGAAIARRDPSLLDAAVDLATPPLAMLTVIVLAGFSITVLAAAIRVVPWWSTAPWAVALVAVPLFVVVGLWSIGASGRIWRVLLGAPLFVGWKLTTYLRLFRGHDVRRWDRTDRVTS